MGRRFEYDGILHEIPGKGGAYVEFPWDIREIFGKGRVRVLAEFDGVPYRGSIVNMGLRDSEGKTVYLIGVLKSIRQQLGKKDGDAIHVVIREEPEEPGDRRERTEETGQDERVQRGKV